MQSAVREISSGSVHRFTLISLETEKRKNTDKVVSYN